MKRLFGVLVLLAALIGAGPVEAACYQWSKTASSNATADPSINWAEGMSPSSVNDSARAMMARLAECRDDLSGVLVTTGTSTVYAVATNQGLPSVPTDGQSLAMRFHTANGASPTLAADGGTAYAIQTKAGTAVAASTLQTDGIYRVTFKLSASAWLLQDFYNAPIATNSITYDKIQQVTASRLLGNATGSLANVAEISVGSGLSFSGSSLVADIGATQLRGFLSGLELSTAGSSSTFSVAVGSANDVNAGGMMVLGSAISKTTASWSVGTGNGALDTGSIAINTWYHGFIIKRPDTGVVDVCVSTSATGCAAGVGNIPAAYTLKRRIGSMRTNASNQWIAFTQVGDQFIWSSPVDNSFSAGTASRNLGTLTVPTGVQVTALFNSFLSGPGVSVILLFTSPSEADTATATIYNLAATPSINAGGSFARLTDTSARIGARANTAITANVFVYGWIDARGK